MTTRIEQIERFENLVRVLDVVAQNGKLEAKFDLDDWFALYHDMEQRSDEDVAAWAKMFDNDDPNLVTIPDKCGTTACACGFAGMDPWFRQQGFKTSLYGDISYITRTQGLEHFSAVEEFFGIESDDALELFTSTTYRDVEGGGSLANVRARVAAFLEELKQKQG